MERLRSALDGDRMPALGTASYANDTNLYEVRCGTCHRMCLVDDITFRNINAAAKAGLETPFCCDVCDDEYDELAFDNRD